MFSLLLLLLILIVLTFITTANDYSTAVLKNTTANEESRPYNGEGNSKLFASRGARKTPYTRVDSGVNAPAGYVGADVADWVKRLEAKQISSRLLSNIVSAQPTKVQQECTTGACINSFFTTFAQFCYLDMTHSTGSTEKWNLPIPKDGLLDNAGTQTSSFTRSKYEGGSTEVRRQINSNTHFLDAEAVYGYNDVYATAIRAGTGGLLKTSKWGGVAQYSEAIHATLSGAGSPGMANVCPRADKSELYLSGSRRMNSLPQLVVLHTLFLREHNRRADRLAKSHSDWTDEQLYQKARTWVVALIQAIFYEEYLPLLLGKKLPAYNKYDSTIDPAVDIFAGTVAMRYGHSEIPSVYGGNGAPVLRDSWFHPQDYVHSNESFVNILNAMLESKQEAIDPYVVDDVRQYTFSCDGQPSKDLAMSNIQRGRDNGLPSYNEARRMYGLMPYSSISDMKATDEVKSRLTTAYGKDGINDVDPWLGALSEEIEALSSVGPLITAALKKQFTRTRDGDRFWYENMMSPEEIKEVKGYKMLDVIANNAGQQLGACKSSPWVDTSHESCSSSESESNMIIANKSPYVAMSWHVVSQTPGSEQLKFTFEFEVTGTMGWMAMAISKEGGMTLADMFIVKMMAPGVESISLHDYYSVEFVAPIEDQVNNLELVSKAFENGRVKVVFHRNGNTLDDKDYVIEKASAVQVGFAWSEDNLGGETTMPYYHGMKRKSNGQINFFSGQADDQDTLKIIHGMIMSVMWMINITLGVITARYRAESRAWFGIHVALQAMGTMLTFPMYILAHWNFVMVTGASWHSIIGNIIVWSCVLQAMLGVHMSLLFEYRVQKSLEKLDEDPSCIAKLKYRWFAYLSEKILEPTCRTHCCCCFSCCCRKAPPDAISDKSDHAVDQQIELTNIKYAANPMTKNGQQLAKRNPAIQVPKVVKVRREIYVHYLHKFYGKTLLLMAYVQVGLGLYTYGTFDEYLNEGKIPTGNKFIMCLLFGVWYLMVIFIFVYKEIMFRCGFAEFTSLDFADYLLDRLIECVGACVRCQCCRKKKEGETDEHQSSAFSRQGSTLSVVSVTASSKGSEDNPRNFCLHFAKKIREEAACSEVSFPKLYRKYLAAFVEEICHLPSSFMPLLKHSGISSIAEVAFVTSENDLAKYLKVKPTKAQAMIRRARRILSYISGVHLKEREEEVNEQLSSVDSVPDPKMYLDGRGLKAVSTGPVRWARKKRPAGHHDEHNHFGVNPAGMVSLKEATEDVAEDVVEDVAEDVAKDVTKDVAKDATDDVAAVAASNVVAEEKVQKNTSEWNDEQDGATRMRAMTEPVDFISEPSDDGELSDNSDISSSVLRKRNSINRFFKPSEARSTSPRHMESERFFEESDDSDDRKAKVERQPTSDTIEV